MRTRLIIAVLSAFAASAGSLAALPTLAAAQIPGAPVTGVLDQASDRALDKLSKSGAFDADAAVRIALPGPAKGLGGMMSLAGKAGVGGDVSEKINAAAGEAAGAAKPIFRAAIDKMTVKDAMGLGSASGATDYLRRTAGPAIRAEIAPLVRAALEKTGLLSASGPLSGLGMDPQSLVDYVAGKTEDGIFLYMGQEEKKLRQNPMGLLGR